MSEKYHVSDDPIYSGEIRKLQDDDPASASQSFNPLFERLIENTAAVKQQADKIQAETGSMEAEKGKPGGTATLDETGKVPVGQLPEMGYDAKGAAAAVEAKLGAHTGDAGNPHRTTKDQVGLGNVDNTSDANKPASTAVKAAIDTVQSDFTSHKGDPGLHVTTAKQSAWNGAVQTASSAQATANEAKTAAEAVQATVDSTLATMKKRVSTTGGSDCDLLKYLNGSSYMQILNFLNFERDDWSGKEL